MAIIVDSDCDGFTSAALFQNQFYMYNADYVKNYISLYFHSGKQHGLMDLTEDILKDNNKLPNEIYNYLSAIKDLSADLKNDFDDFMHDIIN